MFRSPAAPLAFSGTCSWLQTVAAGMLTWCVDFYRTQVKNKSLLLLARAAARCLRSSAGAPCLSTSPAAVYRISKVEPTATAVRRCCEWSATWSDFPNCSEQQQHGSETIRLDSLKLLRPHVFHSFIVAGFLCCYLSLSSTLCFVYHLGLLRCTLAQFRGSAAAAPVFHKLMKSS